jgi:hypothetical protein
MSFSPAAVGTFTNVEEKNEKEELEQHYSTSESSTEDGLLKEFEELCQEIEFLQRNSPIYCKYFLYREYFQQKNLIKAKELQLELKDSFPPKSFPTPTCQLVYEKLKTREEFQERISSLQEKLKNHFEKEFESLALEKPNYLDLYMKCLEYSETLENIVPEQ